MGSIAATRASLRFAAVLALAAGCALGSACAGRSVEAIPFSPFERNLELTVPEPAEVDAGRPAQFRFVLRNRGQERVEACVGRSQQILILPDVRVPVEGRSVIHHSVETSVDQSCERRFSLDPGEELSWTEEIAIQNVVPGPATLMASVQVLNRRDCVDYGCAFASVNATRRVVVRG